MKIGDISVSKKFYNCFIKLKHMLQILRKLQKKIELSAFISENKVLTCVIFFPKKTTK